MNQIKQYLIKNVSKQPVRIERQLEFDLARGFSILFMIAVHVLQVFGNMRVINSPMGEVISFLGGIPAAPVFMVLMGACIPFSRNQTPRRLIFRGLKLFIAGYVLSFFRFFLPLLTGINTGLVSADIFNQIPYTSLTEFLLEVDILQLAGLSLMFIGGLKIFNHRKIIYITIILLVSLTSPLLWGLKTGNPVIDFLLNIFWGDQTYVSFPFFPWISYPVFGFIFGSLLIHSKDKKSFYKSSLIIAASFLVLAIILFFLNLNVPIKNDLENYFCRHGIVGNIFIFSIVIIWLFLIHKMGNKFPGLFKKYLTFCSKNVTAIYVVHWILIGWSVLLLGVNTQGFLMTLIFIFATALVSNMFVMIRSRKYN